MPIKSRIRTVPHYPKQGIMFRDITTLLKDPVGFRITIHELANRYTGMKIDKITGIESRGFILGAPLAYLLGVGFVPIRKKGKLPAETIGHDYELEYGTDRIEMHTDAVSKGDKVLLVDDLIATGGTAFAGIRLLERAGATVIGCSFVIDLPELGGSDRLRGCHLQIDLPSGLGVGHHRSDAGRNGEPQSRGGRVFLNRHAHRECLKGRNAGLARFDGHMGVCLQ